MAASSLPYPGMLQDGACTKEAGWVAASLGLEPTGKLNRPAGTQ